jgi:enoyl-CoA hydratase
MKYNSIIYQKEDGISIITFNRPEKRNAFNEIMTKEIESAIDEAENDADVFAIILTGGLKYFISGTDMEQLLGDGKDLTPQIMYEIHYKTQSVYRHLSKTHKPTIAAMAGYALGGGLELALCCDFRIASENTKIGTPEIKLGLLPGAGGTQRLSRMIGITKAKELVLTGESISAQEALQLGLLNKVTGEANLINEAKTFAKRFKNLPAFAVEMGKAIIDAGSNMGLLKKALMLFLKSGVQNSAGNKNKIIYFKNELMI